MPTVHQVLCLGTGDTRIHFANPLLLNSQNLRGDKLASRNFPHYLARATIFVSVEQCAQPGTILPPKRHLAVREDIFGSHSSGVVTGI